MLLGAKVISDDLLENPYELKTNRIQASFQQKLQSLRGKEQIYQKQADLYARLKDISHHKSINNVSMYSSVMSLNNVQGSVSNLTSEQSIKKSGSRNSHRNTLNRDTINPYSSFQSVSNGLSVSSQMLDSEVDLVKQPPPIVKRRNTTANIQKPELSLYSTVGHKAVANKQLHLIDLIDSEFDKAFETGNVQQRQQPKRPISECTKSSQKPATVARSTGKKFTEQMQEMLSKVRSQRQLEKVSQQDLFQAVGDYRSYDKYRIEELDVSNTREVCSYTLEVHSEKGNDGLY